MISKKNVAVNIGVFLAAIVACSLFIEIGLALWEINTKSNIRFIPNKGTTYIPHAYYRHTKEGFSEGYFNSHGFRDKERSYKKPENTFRILVFGDSYTDALQVPIEQTFVALLEKELNKKSKLKTVEVLNLGQSGFGTADAYMRYLNFGVQYSPDLVILAFYSGNDFRNNSKVLNQQSLAFYFGFDENKNLELDSSLFDEYQKRMTLPKRVFQALARNSYLVSLLSERIYLLRHRSPRGETTENFGNQKNKGKLTLDKFSDLNIYRKKLSVDWEEAFGITKAIIERFRDSANQHGADFVLLTLSNPEQLQLEVQQQLSNRYHIAFDFEKPNKVLEAFAKAKSIMFLDLLPVMKDYFARTREHLHGFGLRRGRGHWNEKGHKIAAETISAFLHELHLVPAL